MCEVTDPVVNQKIETHGEVHRPSNHNANTVWLGVACKELMVGTLDKCVCVCVCNLLGVVCSCM